MRIALVVHCSELDHGKYHAIFSGALLSKPNLATVYNVEDCRHNGNNWRRDKQKDQRARAVEERLNKALVQWPILG